MLIDKVFLFLGLNLKLNKMKFKEPEKLLIWD